MPLKIVADANMPLADELFSRLGEVTRFEGRSLQNTDLRDVDILLVRSVTQVNSELLENTSVKFVGTATIGTDHIDEDFLRVNNIGFASAQGSNANSVAEYILSALVVSKRLEPLLEKKQRLAIVGAGNVGSRLAFFANNLGFEFGCYDPPLQNSLDKRPDWQWLDWQQVLNSDVISLHVPITAGGDYPTEHMFDAKQLSQLKPGCLLINSARGAVIDNNALLKALTNEAQIEAQFQVILDVWEGEPDINMELQKKCLFGSPHIAGYSIDGKQKGTQMLYNALLGFLELLPADDDSNNNISESVNWNADKTFNENLSECILEAYDLSIDSRQLASLVKSSVKKQFDCLRKNYPDRLEFKHYLISNIQPQYRQLMLLLGFQVSD